MSILLCNLNVIAVDLAQSNVITSGNIGSTQHSGRSVAKTDGGTVISLLGMLNEEEYTVPEKKVGFEAVCDI